MDGIPAPMAGPTLSLVPKLATQPELDEGNLRRLPVDQVRDLELQMRKGHEEILRHLRGPAPKLEPAPAPGADSPFRVPVSVGVSGFAWPGSWVAPAATSSWAPAIFGVLAFSVIAYFQGWFGREDQSSSVLEASVPALSPLVLSSLAAAPVHHHHHSHTTIETNVPVPGPRGSTGRAGRDGASGRPGRDGSRGRDGRSGHNGRDGRSGRDGRDGEAGRDGATAPGAIAAVVVKGVLD